MNWPNSIDCLIDYGEQDVKDKTAKLLRSVDQYGPYGPMAEYETSDYEKFWIVAEYMHECQEEKKVPRIPVEVIRRNESIQRKIEFGNQQLNRHSKQQESGLILPDGYDV